MKNESFDRLIGKLSEEAEAAKAEDARQLALQARRDKIRQQVIFGVLVILYGAVYFERGPISDNVAKLFSTKEPEYRSIMKLSDEVDAEKSGVDDTANDPTGRKAKLKKTLRDAKAHAAMVDDVMNDNLEPKKK